MSKKIKMITNENKNHESGNVLFLILIAVALFAALSYAVTQSSRSGGGSANEETSLINSASISQYPASVRTAIIRMMISNNVDATEINFDPPPYDDLTTTALQNRGVFYPSPVGGGATYTASPADVMDDGNPGTWYFSASYRIQNIGLDSAGSGNDVIAFLPGLRDSICNRLNDELGIPTTDRTVAADLDVTAASVQMDYDYTFPSATTAIFGTDGGAESFDGQAFGCITDSAGENIYYHVLIER